MKKLPQGYQIPDNRGVEPINRFGDETVAQRLAHAEHETGSTGPDGRPTNGWRRTLYSADAPLDEAGQQNSLPSRNRSGGAGDKWR